MGTKLTDKLIEQTRKRLIALPPDKFVITNNKYKIKEFKHWQVFSEGEYANNLSESMNFTCRVEAFVIDDQELLHSQWCTFSGSAKVESFEVTDIDSNFILTPTL